MDNSILSERQENIQSLIALPATHITESDRAVYIARASAGEDVRAYGHNRLQLDGFLNVWDTDTRIAYGPLATRWYIRSAFHHGKRWTVTIVSPVGDHQQVTIHLDIAPHPVHETHYPAYAARVLLSLVNHCSAFNLDPVAQLNNSHH